jgi:hypothetical protein
MAYRIASTFKAKLSEIIGIGHRPFGKVATRHPYRDDEDEGGAGSGLQLEEHPFLANCQIGAASDLTAIANQNVDAEQEALDNADKCCPQLRMQAKLAAALTNQFNPKPGMMP